MKYFREHWRGLMLGSALAAVAARWLIIWFLPSPGLDERAFLPEVFPDTYGFTEKQGTPPRFEAFTLDERGEELSLGAVFRTTEVADVPRGYAGPVPVLVGLDREGSITGVRLLAHNETPSYAAPVGRPEFLRQFVGRRIFDPLRLEDDIDGVTRATVTAAAVTDGIRIAARSVASRAMGLTVPVDEGGAPPLPWPALAALAVTMATALASLRWKSAPLRWISLALGFCVLGYWQGVYLSATAAANILLGRLPAFHEHLLWYALVLFGIGTALFWRNVYCARMCPFGALQEFLHLLTLTPMPAEGGEDRQARRLRYVFLWLVVVAVFVFGRTEAANYEPFSTAFDFKGGVLRWVFLGLVLILAGLRHRFWCRYFCPTGLWLQLLGRMRSYNPFD